MAYAKWSVLLRPAFPAFVYELLVRDDYIFFRNLIFRMEWQVITQCVEQKFIFPKMLFFNLDVSTVWKFESLNQPYLDNGKLSELLSQLVCKS